MELNKDINRVDHTYKNGDYKRYFNETPLRIFGFFEDYRFLSNFHKCEVLWDGIIWPSSEHAYMVAKCRDRRWNMDQQLIYDYTPVEDIRRKTCSQVKKWGKEVELRPDWEVVKNDIMFSILLDKFTRNTDLREDLIATGDKILIEANSWGDQWWGYDVDAEKGENYLGQTLMKIRYILKG